MSAEAAEAFMTWFKRRFGRVDDDVVVVVVDIVVEAADIDVDIGVVVVTFVVDGFDAVEFSGLVLCVCSTVLVGGSVF